MSNLTAQVKSIHEDAKSCALEVLEETIQQLSRLDASLGEIMSAIATAEVELDKRVGAREKLHGPPGKCLRARREELWDADCEFADNILTTAAFRLENSHFSWRHRQNAGRGIRDYDEDRPVDEELRAKIASRSSTPPLTATRLKICSAQTAS